MLRCTLLVRKRRLTPQRGIVGELFIPQGVPALTSLRPRPPGVADSGSHADPPHLGSHRGPGGTLQEGGHRDLAPHRTQHPPHCGYITPPPR